MPEQCHTFKVGDRVQWVTKRVSRGGNRIAFKTRRGIVLTLWDDTALVREDGTRNGKLLTLKGLSPERDIGGPLTDLLYALAGQPVPEHLRESAKSADNQKS